MIPRDRSPAPTTMTGVPDLPIPADEVPNLVDPKVLIGRGEIERTARVLGAEQVERADRDPGDEILLMWTRIALERRNLGRAAELLDQLQDPDAAGARVLQGDLLVRNRHYDDHYDLVFAVVRSQRLTNLQLGSLALQTGELAVISGNHVLAAELFGFASELLETDPLLNARRETAQRIVGHYVDGAPLSQSPSIAIVPPGCPAAAVASLARLAATTDITAVVDDKTIAQLRDIITELREAGLVDLSRRARALLGALSPGPQAADLDPEVLAHCPWVPTDLLYHRFDRCPDSEFDFWAQALEHRASAGPHSSLVTETSDVVRWARSIYDQHQQNVALDRAIEQTRSGWRELANLTSNEIRGLLTSLGVAADLRRSGSTTPVGLELALVHRIAALTTMTQLGASEAPSEVERPPEAGSSAARLLEEVIAGEQPIFEWAQRSLRFTNRIDPDVTIDVNPSAMSDMLRWLLLSATTGSLSTASIEITASTTPANLDSSGAELVGRNLIIEILSRTPTPPEPERHRELGLGSKTTAYRAAVMLVRSWNGTFSANYTTAGLDIIIRLPTTKVDDGDRATSL